MCSKIVSAIDLQIGKGLLDAVGYEPEIGKIEWLLKFVVFIVSLTFNFIHALSFYL